MKKLEEMTLREKIGQMMVTGFPGFSMNEDFRSLVRDYKVGNVILFRYNQRDFHQLKELCQSLNDYVGEETGLLPLITSDEEGGVVSRLPEDMAKMPSALAQAAVGDADRVEKAALYTARELRAVGINFNLAPILDINNNTANPVIGVRSYGTTADTVCRYALAALRGYRAGEILTTGKHFPGHGDTAVDSHLGLPVINKTLEELEQLELIPFKKAIEEDVSAITIAHILFPALEAQKIPATMSGAIITGLLRKKLGFKGLIISDCMEMDAIKKYYGVPKGVKDAVKAGMDIVFISRTADEVRESIKLLEEAVDTGEIPISRIDDAVSRILQYKQRGAAPALSIDEAEMAEMRKFAQDFTVDAIAHSRSKGQDVFVLGSNPLFLSPPRKTVTLASNLVNEEYSFAMAMQQRFGGDAYVMDIDPSEAEIAKLCSLANGHSSVVFGTVNGNIYSGQMQLARKLADTKLPLAWVALRNPFELNQLPQGNFGLALYEYSPTNVELATRFFTRE